MTDYTIITTEAEFTVEADRYRRDDNDDLYCYIEPQDEAVVHVDAEDFVAIFETDCGQIRKSS